MLNNKKIIIFFIIFLVIILTLTNFFFSKFNLHNKKKIEKINIKTLNIFIENEFLKLNKLFYNKKKFINFINFNIKTIENNISNKIIKDIFIHKYILKNNIIFYSYNEIKKIIKYKNIFKHKKKFNNNYYINFFKKKNINYINYIKKKIIYKNYKKLLNNTNNYLFFKTTNIFIKKKIYYLINIKINLFKNNKYSYILYKKENNIKFIIKIIENFIKKQIYEKNKNFKFNLKKNNYISNKNKYLNKIKKLIFKNLYNINYKIVIYKQKIYILLEKNIFYKNINKKKKNFIKEINQRNYINILINNNKLIT